MSPSLPRGRGRRRRMTRWTVPVFVVALPAVAFGIGGFSSGATPLLRIFFFLSLGVFLVSAVVAFFRRPPHL